MRTLFDNSLGFRQSGGPFLGINFSKLFQDAQPLIQDTRNLIKNQGTQTSVTPTAQPPLAPVPKPAVDNSTLYLLLGALAVGGLGAAWYVFRKKKPAPAGGK